MLGDIRLLASTTSDRKALDKAEQFHAQALAAWRRGQPVSVGRALLAAPPTASSTSSSDYGLSYDGSADRDGDGVPDVLELRAGSDPRLRDTDRDGLTDRFEILVPSSHTILPRPTPTATA